MPSDADLLQTIRLRVEKLLDEKDRSHLRMVDGVMGAAPIDWNITESSDITSSLHDDGALVVEITTKTLLFRAPPDDGEINF